jgi:hypothetical protein
MMRKLGEWSIEFAKVFFRTVAGMVAFAFIHSIIGKLFEPFAGPLYDLAGSSGTVPRLLAIIAAIAIQFWLTYKILVFLLIFYFEGDQRRSKFGRL